MKRFTARSFPRDKTHAGNKGKINNIIIHPAASLKEEVKLTIGIHVSCVQMLKLLTASLMPTAWHHVNNDWNIYNCFPLKLYNNIPGCQIWVNFQPDCKGVVISLSLINTGTVRKDAGLAIIFKIKLIVTTDGTFVECVECYI